MSYQDTDDAASTDPVACGVRSPVWLVYDILRKKRLSDSSGRELWG